MRSTSQLLIDARSAMAKQPTVWLPPFLISALQLMASGPYQNELAQSAVFLSANLGVFFIEAGWLRLIGLALADQPARMEDFKAGVNQHWPALLAGNLMFYGLLAALLAGAIGIGHHYFTIDALMGWYGELEKLPPEKLNESLVPERIPVPVRGWMQIFAGWAGVSAVVGFLLLFWQPVVVLRNVSWWRGWAASVSLAFRRFPQAVMLATLHLLMLFAALGFVAGRSLPIAMLGLAMLLVVMTYFKVIYAALVADAWPPAVDARA